MLCEKTFWDMFEGSLNNRESYQENVAHMHLTQRT